MGDLNARHPRDTKTSENNQRFRGDRMIEIGTLVKYKDSYVTDCTDGVGWIGIVVDQQSGGLRFLVEWNHYNIRVWRHINVLEVICK